MRQPCEQRRCAHRPLPTALLAVLLLLPIGTEPGAAEQRKEESATRPGPIAELILHFDGSQPEVTIRAHTQLLMALGPHTHANVAVESQADAALFRASLHLPEELWDRIRFLVVGGPISIWARDRYVVREASGDRALLRPLASSVTPSRRADLTVGRLVAESQPDLPVCDLPISLEGGDLLIGMERALISPSTLSDNAERLELPAEEVLDQLTRALGVPVLVIGEGLPEPPHGHLDMYVALVDDQTAFVGDPGLALRVWSQVVERWGQDDRMPGLAPPTRAEQEAVVAAYDATASELRAAGLRVARLPVVHAGEAVLTWTNALTERRGTQDHAYVPTYGLATLDRLAQATWRAAGFRVHPIDVTRCIQQGGAVRCLTNTIRVPRATTPRVRVETTQVVPAREATPRMRAR
jgi:N-dimethylarginine dimethylaminohydrolase